MTTCGFLEWPDGLEPSGARWDGLRRQVDAAAPDLLVANEMPFGVWLAAERRFDRDAASRSVDLHEAGLEALAALGVRSVIASRPVWAGKKLANEAFVIEAGRNRPLHRKSHFPEEDGWFEATWFQGDGSHSKVHEICDLKVGVLLCTDLMFNERCRFYGREGADLIAVPRAAGRAHDHWMAAGAMAAIVSGSYVVSSNRTGSSKAGPIFGGLGFVFSPDGKLISTTSPDSPLTVVAIDSTWTKRRKREYPCYVSETPLLDS